MVNAGFNIKVSFCKNELKTEGVTEVTVNVA
jgi:hypothetical protein